MSEMYFKEVSCEISLQTWVILLLKYLWMYTYKKFKLLTIKFWATVKDSIGYSVLAVSRKSTHSSFKLVSSSSFTFWL